MCLGHAKDILCKKPKIKRQKKGKWKRDEMREREIIDDIKKIGRAQKVCGF